MIEKITPITYSRKNTRCEVVIIMGGKSYTRHLHKTAKGWQGTMLSPDVIAKFNRWHALDNELRDISRLESEFRHAANKKNVLRMRKIERDLNGRSSAEFKRVWESAASAYHVNHPDNRPQPFEIFKASDNVLAFGKPTIVHEEAA